MLKAFDGRKATTDYMSTHTLAFSTPELTLTRFAFWLGDTVPDPDNKDKVVPRVMTFMTEQDFTPVVVDDDTYAPTGAVKNTTLYGNPATGGARFCFECGNRISVSAKFCNKCGITQN